MNNWNLINKEDHREVYNHQDYLLTYNQQKKQLWLYYQAYNIALGTVADEVWPCSLEEGQK